MRYEIKYSKEFGKFVLKHPEMASKINESFEVIATNPYENTLDIKKLKGKQNHYRLRLGKYRFFMRL